MNTNTDHARYLRRINNRLDLIGEDPNTIAWVMSEGVWMRPNSVANNPLCDLIICYYHDYFSLVELKRSHKQKPKALRQLSSSQRFVRDWFDAGQVCKKIVYYGNFRRDGYEIELV